MATKRRHSSGYQLIRKAVIESSFACGYEVPRFDEFHVFFMVTVSNAMYNSFFFINNIIYNISSSPDAEGLCLRYHDDTQAESGSHEVSVFFVRT